MNDTAQEIVPLSEIAKRLTARLNSIDSIRLWLKNDSDEYTRLTAIAQGLQVDIDDLARTQAFLARLV